MAFGKFGKYYPGGVSCRAERLDLVAELVRLVEGFRVDEGRAHDVRFTSAAERFWLETDPQHLRYIVVNLLHNAAKYSPVASVIDVTLETGNAKARISVSDEGIGVPEAELDDLFSPFYRASNVGDRPGTGMGLPIVKKSARLIGASVSVERRDGPGTTFVVELPVVRRPAPA